jgi:Rod binding domain-containing protein
MTDSIQPFGTPYANGPGLQEAFDQSVGSTFFRQMLKSLRSSSGKPAYFHGGQAEEIFQSQLDEILISDMAKANGNGFSAELFQQQFPNHSENQPAASKSSATSDSLPESTPKQPAPPSGNNFQADA